MEKDIDEFGESVVVYYHRRHLWSGEQTEKFVADHKDDLSAHFNSEFYSRDSYLARPLYSDALLPLVKNDYEYALWSQYLYSGRGPLKSYYDGRYPFGAFIEFTDADRLLDRGCAKRAAAGRTQIRIRTDGISATGTVFF
jgi:hypothetical protein